MAITVTSPQSLIGFIKNGVSADASGCETVVAAVAGKKIKVRHLSVNSAGAQSITIGEGETTGAVTTALIGPVAMAANTTLQWDFNPPMELTAATALTVDSSSNDQVCVFAQGVYE